MPESRMLPSQKQQDAEWVVKEEVETDWDHGKRPEQRSIKELLDNGIVLIDKPNGPTSNQISAWMKKLLGRKKTGHSGTLDPHVTGVLPIGLNRGTKVLGPLSKADKEYVCVMKLDERVPEEEIRETASEFVGSITQLPPEKSAVKREERDRKIYYLDILEVDGKFVLFKVGCERGFYVRTFCEQFGESLDTKGVSGSMEELRRTHVGAFSESSTHTLQDVVDEYEYWKNGDEHTLGNMVLPVEAGVRHIPKVIVKDSAVAALTHGADLGSGGISKLQRGIEENSTIAVLTLKGELVATATALTHTNGMVAKNETVAELDRVYMNNDVYPKRW